MTAKLYRSRTDKKVFGVCGGLAQALNVDVTLLRVIFVVATIFSSGAAGLLYLIAGLFIPEEPAGFRYGQGDEYGDGPHASYASHSSNPSYWGWAGFHKCKHTRSSPYSEETDRPGSFAGGAAGSAAGFGKNGGMGSGAHMNSVGGAGDAYGHAMHAGSPGSAYYRSSAANAATNHAASTGHAAESQSADLDALMREVETKALRKEIEELKQKLAQFEKMQEKKEQE